MCHRDRVQCIIPPYITERLARSGNAEVRARAEANLLAAQRMREARARGRTAPSLLPERAPGGGKHRLLHDAHGKDKLPGALVRSEGQGPVATYDFYNAVFGRDSLDDRGMKLVGSVHVGESDGGGRFVPLDNAFWNGRQMAYGDGDGLIFQRFTRSLDVVGHELTHGVQSFTSNLEYEGESGALNEHFADVFGVLVRQWKNGESALRADWVIGKEVLVSAPTRRGVRDMEHPGTAFTDDPYLGSDPQPAHMSGFYKGNSDSGGVHINSGIPNRAFVLAAKALGGHAWDAAGGIWYETMLRLPSRCDFQECAEACVQTAAARGADAAQAVRAAWAAVGVKTKVYA
jgi:Zn-dependent metalloprotease